VSVCAAACDCVQQRGGRQTGHLTGARRAAKKTLWSDDHTKCCPYFSTTSDTRTSGACSSTVHDARRRPALSTVAAGARECGQRSDAAALARRTLRGARCAVRHSHRRLAMSVGLGTAKNSRHHTPVPSVRLSSFAMMAS